jgi:hypothetical protein
MGITLTPHGEALTSHFPSQQGVDLSCQSPLRHSYKSKSDGAFPWAGIPMFYHFLPVELQDDERRRAD